MSVVELLEFAESTDVLVGNEVDGNTLATETTRTSNSVDVVLEVAGQVVVNHKGNLLDINTTSKKIGGDQNSAGTSTEFVQDNITLRLANISVLDK